MLKHQKLIKLSDEDMKLVEDLRGVYGGNISQIFRIALRKLWRDTFNEGTDLRSDPSV